MSSFYRFLAAVVGVTVIALLHRPALADVRHAYAAVVCKDDRALIRFTFAWNNDQPVFTRPGPRSVQGWGWALMASKPIDPELDQLVPKDPSQCTLQDGRKILLRQDDMGDAVGYGQCGGDTTQIFSFWVGGKKIYSREVWYPKCGFPSEITEILLDGNRLTECRMARKWLSTDVEPETCTDQSVRLSKPIHDNEDDGKIALVRSALNRGDFCRSLIKPWSPPPWSTVNWPTYPHEERETVEYPKIGQSDPTDLLNSGGTSRVVSWEGWTGGPNGDESIWAVLPDSASESDAQSLQRELRFAGEAEVNALRTSGIIVFAGDQTAYHSVWHVHLTPFLLDGTTWMHASLSNRIGWGVDPSDIILRPTPKGDLEEVCVFRINPPL